MVGALQRVEVMMDGISSASDRKKPPRWVFLQDAIIAQGWRRTRRIANIAIRLTKKIIAHSERVGMAAGADEVKLTTNAMSYGKFDQLEVVH